MEIVVYIENNIYDADLGLIHSFLSLLSAETTIRFVGLTQGVYRTLSGLGIMVTSGIDQVKHADLLVVLGDEKKVDANSHNFNQWLMTLSQSAACVVGLSSGAVHLLASGSLNGDILTYPPHHSRLFKRLSQSAKKTSIVESSKFITTSIPSATYAALCLAIKKVYGEHKLAKLQMDTRVNFDRWLNENSRCYQNYKSLHNSYIKSIEKNRQHGALNAVFYLFDEMNIADLLFTAAALTHLPFKLNYISNTSGKIYTKDNHFKIIADDAIQKFNQCDLFVLCGGKSVTHCLVNEYLTHWVSKIAPASYRVLTIGEGEQILGVSGALRDVDSDVLNHLSLGEGKYLIVKDSDEAVESVLYIGANEYHLNRKQFNTYFGLEKDQRIND